MKQYKFAQEVEEQEVNEEFYKKYSVTPEQKKQFQHVKTYTEFLSPSGQCFQLLVTKPESYKESVKENLKEFIDGLKGDKKGA